MNKIATTAASALLALGLLTGCGSASSTPATPSAAQGKVEVHDRIKATTDCTKLQADFDLADANGKVARNNGNSDLAQANTAYMKTALDRQNELKCFG